ncbi:BppU family phage baseplate upper protein [Lactobacillus crispatus]|uniref:BppU family phage baseplate upper protein n=1 Tax=Lactobacillus crispatus TaxID=47770 RepID=UPI001F14DBDB|nr:BppU family phage baseplate upper protein [Lactobacillus crispatus]
MAVKADITIDIDKQVGELQNLTQIYNARVGDNKTPLTIAWRKNDLPLNLKGLHAYIVGKTGDGSYNSETGKIDFPINTPVSQFEDDGSGTLDGGQSGLTTLLIPKQMWQNSGLFAGYIGLKSEDGSVFTSKDIWFKVLGNVLDAGVEINYFIGDFDKALAEAEKKLQDKTDSFDQITNAALSDLREKYREIAQSSEDLASEYTATLNNITDSLKSMQAYIETHNIVTTDKFENLDKYLTNKVATSYVQPQAFNNLDDLKQKYPNGSNGIMVTTDNGHYYLWNNNSWKDCGTYQSTGIADKSIHLENLSDTLENSLYPNVDEVEITNLLDGYFSKYGTVITQHNASDGDPVHTEKIPVKPGEEYYVYTNNYWDGKAINMMENDTIINYFPSENDAQIKSIKITIPNNVDSLILNGTKQFVPRLFKINSYNQDQDAIDNLAIILKDKEFNFKEINLTQINKTGYWDYTRNGNYTDQAPDNKNAMKSYLPVKVKPFEIYRLTGCSAWNARLYEIIDFQGHLISCCDNENSQSLTTTFMIPKNAAYLERL